MADSLKSIYVQMPQGISTHTFLRGEDALQGLPALLQENFPGRTPWIVADENTWKAAGAAAYQLLQNAGMNPAEPHIYPGTPRLHPDYALAEKLAEEMPANTVPVAIGSGVINDMVKCVGGINHVTYCCVATACSVDGYTAAGAAMTVNGTKKTVPCPAPYAICADTSILATAPADMFASGYADLLAKVPAGGDWILADAMGEDPIRKDVWELIQGPLKDQVSDCTNMLKIFTGLASTGYAMQMMKDSRPASGAEHLFSHVWEMEGLQLNGEDISHGFKVGVGTLASTLLLEYITNHKLHDLAPRMKPVPTVEEREKEVDTLLIRGCYGTAPKETAMKKFRSGEAGEKRRKEIMEKWDSIGAAVKAQILTSDQIRTALKTANCPAVPAEIGLDQEQFIHGILTAQLIRNRYTSLDFLYEMGLLDDAVAYVATHMEG
ncbi:MAG: sn-glycerol-1-phosphate dehydrogenase [Lentisphaeria bacterium]|nr:sn-glycerol-1-phosphate dehydrogenase [Lentisphaeria bacterium]